MPRASGAARLWRGREAAAALISNNLGSGTQTADKLRMSIGSLSSIASGFVESLINKALTSNSTGKTTTSGTASTSQTSDSNQLSPFAQLLSTLQQLQQSNPAEYEQVTKQIATNLTAAAQTATSAGNTTLASTLTQLATDFTTASQNDQMPSIQDLAAATGHHHHHGHHGSTSTSSTDASGTSAADSTGTSSSSSTSDLLSQLIASYQSSTSTSQSTDPMAIITSTLASAGITV